MPEALPLRVGILHFTAPPIVGGVEAIVGCQARALAARGHYVTVLAGRGRFRASGIEFRHIPALDSKYPPLLAVNRALARGEIPSGFHHLVEELSAALASVVDALDVCVVHNAMTLHFNLPLTVALHRQAAAEHGCPLVAWCHDLSWTNPLYAGVVYDRYPWTILKTTAPRTEYVVVSEDRREDLAELTALPVQAISVIPAGVDAAEKWAIGNATVRMLRQHYLLSADPFILLPVRITRRKNIEFAIEVVAELRNHGLKPMLLVTGPRGPHDPASNQYVTELHERIRSLRVEGEVILLQAELQPGRSILRPSDQMMNELYRAADLMLMPSAQEGFGIPLLEAGIVGMPIFCSDIAPFHEIAGRSAEYFGLDTAPAELAQRIARFVATDRRYALRKRVVREFEWERIIDSRTIPVLRKAAARGAPPRSMRSGLAQAQAAFT